MPGSDLPSAKGSPSAKMVARPLIPLTLSLALGVASSAWAPKLPPLWLAAAAAVLFLTLLLSFLTDFSARLVPLVLFGVLGLAVAQQALHPVFPPQHVASLPQGETITLKGWGRESAPLSGG